jgi:hypothetical protein
MEFEISYDVNMNDHLSRFLVDCCATCVAVTRT